MSTVILRHDPQQSDLERRVRIFLQKQCADLRALEVEVDNDVVVVRGRVPNSSAKQLASACCLRVAGVRRVVNEATVAKASSN